MEPTKTRVLVLGGGFAGLKCCQQLDDPQIEVTLLDRNNHHLFQPLLYQVATANLSAPDIAAPIREVLRERDNVQVCLESVENIDLEAQTVTTNLREHAFDYLVIGLGAATGYFGHPEWETYAPGMKTLEDARSLRRRVLHALERAELTEDPEERKRLLTITIVGGGPTGVELAGAFTELMHHAMKDGFRNVRPTDLNITLVEAAPQILGMFHENQSQYAKQRLEKLGITVMTNTMVKDVQKGRVVLTDGEIESENIIWAAGIEANPVTAKMDVEKNRAGRLMVNPDCSLTEYPNVFAVGDIAACTDRKGVQVPMLGSAAMQMGKHAADLIMEEVAGIRQGQKPRFRRQFAYFDKGIMAIIGKSAAVMKAKKIHMQGFIAWLAWLLVHLLLLVGFRNKIAVILQWGFAFTIGKSGARIFTPQGKPHAKK